MLKLFTLRKLSVSREITALSAFSVDYLLTANNIIPTARVHPVADISRY